MLGKVTDPYFTQMGSQTSVEFNANIDVEEEHSAIFEPKCNNTRVYDYYPSRDALAKLLYTEGRKQLNEVEANMICGGRLFEYMSNRRGDSVSTPIYNSTDGCITTNGSAPIIAYYQTSQLVHSSDGEQWRRCHSDFITGSCFLVFNNIVVFTHLVKRSCTAHAMALDKLLGVSMDSNITPDTFGNMMRNSLRSRFANFE